MSGRKKPDTENVDAGTRSDASTIPPETDTRKNSFGSKFEALQRLDAISRAGPQGETPANTICGTGRRTVVTEEGVRKEEKHALCLLSEARKKTTRAALNHRRSLL